MLLQNEICSVQITVDKLYTVESADNRHYDYVLNPDNYHHNDFCKTFAIKIDLLTKIISIALVGDFYSYESDCAILDGDILTVLQNDTITQIKVCDGSIIIHKQLDCFGCNFGIYKVRKGYVVYGEIDITMLDLELNIMWTFSGRDIFVTNSNKKPFELCENTIKLYDWEDNYYEIDFDGNLVS